MEDELSGDSEDSLGKIQAVKQSGGKLLPLKVCEQVDKCKIPMKIDTGHPCLQCQRVPSGKYGLQRS